jgi:hypothetical protein
VFVLHFHALAATVPSPALAVDALLCLP